MTAYATYPDQQLTALLHQNDEQAFSHIYNRYWKQLYISAHNVLQDQNAAKDVVQEVFTSLWARKNEVSIESLKSYLFQSTRFQVFKAIRAEKNDAAFYQRFKTVAGQILIDDPVLFKELQYLINDVIASLPDDQREIFLLNRTEGLTYSQIAAQKNISVKTVEKKMSLALKHLRLGINDTMIILMVIKALN